MNSNSDLEKVRWQKDKIYLYFHNTVFVIDHSG